MDGWTGTDRLCEGVSPAQRLAGGQAGAAYGPGRERSGRRGRGEGAEAAGGAGGVRPRTAGCPEGLENADERTHGLVSGT